MAISVHIKKRLKDFELNVAFEMESGCMGLLGASGCGKSMTLKCIAGIETPDSGRITLDGRVLYDSEKKINVSPQKRKVGYLFQQYALFPHMTVWQNVEAGLSGARKKFASQKEKNDYIMGLLEQFHIPELADALPVRLSGGQQQRAALARIIASDPDILLLDEPFSAMDSYLREQLLQEMKAMLATTYQKDVLMVSHNRDEIYQMCPKMAVMRPGAIEIAGSTRELFRNPLTLGAARLTGCKNLSRAEVLGPHELYATDWGVKLRVKDVIAEDITHVGLRAHDFETVSGPFSDDRDNVMKCALERITEAPFEIYLILKNVSSENADGKNVFVKNTGQPGISPEGTGRSNHSSGEEELHPIWWKLSKKEWEEMHEKIPEEIYFPPEKIILLKQ